MLYGHSFAFRKKQEEKKRVREKLDALYANYTPPYTEKSPKKLEELKETDLKEYLRLASSRGGKKGGKTTAQRHNMKVRGCKGGLATRKVKRKQYVTGTQHGNFGRLHPRKPIELSDEQYMERLIKEVEYKIKNPGAYIPLTWSPSGWKPGEIPKDIPIFDDRGNLLFPRVPQGGESEDIR